MKTLSVFALAVLILACGYHFSATAQESGWTRYDERTALEGNHHHRSYRRGDGVRFGGGRHGRGSGYYCSSSLPARDYCPGPYRCW